MDKIPPNPSKYKNTNVLTIDEILANELDAMCEKHRAAEAKAASEQEGHRHLYWTTYNHLVNDTVAAIEADQDACDSTIQHPVGPPELTRYEDIAVDHFIRDMAQKGYVVSGDGHGLINWTYTVHVELK